MKLEDIRVLVENSVRTEILQQINGQTEVQQVEESDSTFKKTAGVDNKNQLDD